MNINVSELNKSFMTQWHCIAFDEEKKK